MSRSGAQPASGDIACPHCGASNDDGAERCRACDRQLSAPVTDEAKGTDAPTLAAPRRRWWVAGLALASLAIAVDGGLRVRDWMIRPAELVAEYAAPAGQLTVVRYSPPGQWLVAGSATGDVFVWSTVDGKRVPLQALSSEPITALAFAADGFLVAGSAEGRLLGWDVAGARTEESPPFPAAIGCVAIPRDRLEMAIGLFDGTLVLRDRQGMNVVKSGHAGGVTAAAYAPLTPLLVTGGGEGKLIWWDPATRTAAATTSAHDTEISGLAFSPDGKWLVSGCLNGVLRVWNASTREQEAEWTQPDAVAGLGVADDRFATGSWDGRLRAWSLPQGSPLAEFDTGSLIVDLTLSTDGRRAATVSDDTRVRLWKLPER